MRGPERSLATVLFTDIVGSTERAAELRDAGWRDLRQRHDQCVRRELRRFGGHEINTAGDSFLATFASPARAIVCADAIRASVHELGLEVRAGLHMGELEVAGRELGGLALNIGARVAAEAGPGEILVSGSVHDALAGSQFDFEDRGVRVLKGVPGEWRLFAVTQGSTDAGDLPNRLGWLHVSGRRAFLGGMAAIAVLLAGLYVGRRESSPGLTSAESPAATHRQVTFLGNVLGSAISPDGEVIAYASRFGRGDDRLFVQDLAGGEPLEIGRYDEVGRIRWSPSGQTLAVNTAVGTQAATLLLPRMGGSSRLVKEKWGWFDWSPDGRQLVTSSIDKKLRFFEISTGDTTSVALPDSYTWCNDLDWSPRGDRIAYLTFAEPSRYSIWTIGAGGDGARRVVEDTIPVWAPRWSGLGDAIHYLRTSGETTELVRLEISPTSGEGLPPPRVILTGWDIADFSLSEDGNRMLYSRDQTQSNIWLVSPGASADPDVEPLTTGTAWKSSFSLSPDGRHIALSMGSPHSNIHVQPIDGGTMKQLTYLQGRNENPAWSPDGSDIVFASNHSGRNQVWKVSTDGGTPRAYSETEVSESFQMTWAPGEEILYQESGNRNFRVLDPETGAERPFVSNEEVGWMFDPIYSPDGTKVAVLWNRPPDPGVWSISQDGGEQILVSERADVTPVGWSLDGESIYGYRRDTSQVVRYSTTNGSAAVVASIECGSYVLTVRMTPDEKRFLCLGEEPRSDLWVAEGLNQP